MCDHCDGGYNYREVYMGSGQSRTVKAAVAGVTAQEPSMKK